MPKPAERMIYFDHGARSRIKVTTALAIQKQKARLSTKPVPVKVGRCPRKPPPQVRNVWDYCDPLCVLLVLAWLRTRRSRTDRIALRMSRKALPNATRPHSASGREGGVWPTRHAPTCNNWDQLRLDACINIAHTATSQGPARTNRIDLRMARMPPPRTQRARPPSDHSPA